MGRFGSQHTAYGHPSESETEPIVHFDFDPAALTQRFDIVLDTAGTLPGNEARKMLTPNGRIISIKPSPANMARSAIPGPFHVVIAQPVTADIEAVARAAGDGHLRLPIARAVPLSGAIPALTELERNGSAKRGKLIILPGSAHPIGVGVPLLAVSRRQPMGGTGAL